MSTSRDRPALRIGVLGAGRITEMAMIEPARLVGAQVVAIAARDAHRAKQFARQHGIPRAYGSYQELVDDHEIDLVYNALVNSLHTRWNIAALQAGRHVLTEKPFAANAIEAAQVRSAAAAADRLIVEGFHYSHHPVTHRLGDIVRSGALGTIQNTNIDMFMSAPPDADPRWSMELAGGAMMDLGCYAVNAMRQFGKWSSGEPRLLSAEGSERRGRPGVDEWMRAELEFPNGLTGTIHVNMASEGGFSMPWTISGERGSVLAPAWPVPHTDDRIITTTDQGSQTHHLGTRTSYTYQLEALSAALRGDFPFPSDANDAVRNMELIDDIYRGAGFAPRGQPSQKGTSETEPAPSHVTKPPAV